MRILSTWTKDSRTKDPQAKNQGPRFFNPRTEDPQTEYPRIKDPRIEDPVHGLEFCRDKKGIPKDRLQLTTENVCEMSKT